MADFRSWDARTPEENQQILSELDLGTDVLGIFTQVMREWGETRTALSPQEWGRHAWDNTPDLGDALRVLRGSRYVRQLADAPVL
jgi:hypothetical protein